MNPPKVLRRDAGIILVVALRVTLGGDDRSLVVTINDPVGRFACADTGAVPGTWHDIVLAPVDLNLHAVIALCQDESCPIVLVDQL